MTSTTDQTLLIFRIAGIACAVPAQSVGSIVMPPAHLTHPPGSGRSTPGIFHHADFTYSVIDLHARFGIDTPRKGPGRLLLHDEGVRHFAFQVDEVVGLVSSEQGQWAPLPPYLPRTLFWSGFLYQKEIVLCTELKSLRSMHDAAPLQRHFEALQRQREVQQADSAAPAATTPAAAIPRTPVSNGSAEKTGVQERGKQAPPVHRGTTTKTRKPPPPLPRRPLAKPGEKAEGATKPGPVTTPPTGRLTTNREHALTGRAAPSRASTIPGNQSAAERNTTPLPTVRHKPAQNASAPVAEAPPTASQMESPQTLPAAAGHPHSGHDDSDSGGGGWLLAILLLLLLLPVGYWLWPQAPQSPPLSEPPAPAAPASGDAEPLSVAEIAPPADNLAEEAAAPTTPPQPQSQSASERKPDKEEKAVALRIERDTEGTLNLIFDRNAISASGGTPTTPSRSESTTETVSTGGAATAKGKTATAAQEETGEKMEPNTIEAAAAQNTASSEAGGASISSEASTVFQEQAELPLEPEPDWPAPTPVEPCECLHIVERGDTLWDIASRYTGNAFNYPELARRSGITNPDLIYPGDKVRIIIR